MAEGVMDVIFILDGAPSGNEPCAFRECPDPATGIYEVCDAETMAYLLTVALCQKHGMSLVTGVAPRQD